MIRAETSHAKGITVYAFGSSDEIIGFYLEKVNEKRFQTKRIFTLAKVEGDHFWVASRSREESPQQILSVRGYKSRASPMASVVYCLLYGDGKLLKITRNRCSPATHPPDDGRFSSSALITASSTGEYSAVSRRIKFIGSFNLTSFTAAMRARSLVFGLVTCTVKGCIRSKSPLDR